MWKIHENTNPKLPAPFYVSDTDFTYLHQNGRPYSTAIAKVTTAWYLSEVDAKEAIKLYKSLHLSNKEKQQDIPVEYGHAHPWMIKHIVYDPQQREYYNKDTDIFLCEADIKYHELRPYSHIVTPLPVYTPRDYFTNLDYPPEGYNYDNQYIMSLFNG